MARKKEPDVRWCQGCQEFREMEDTGEREVIDRRKHKVFKCKTCQRINKFCN